jgi:hypothetical protein
MPVAALARAKLSLKIGKGRLVAADSRLKKLYKR